MIYFCFLCSPTNLHHLQCLRQQQAPLTLLRTAILQQLNKLVRITPLVITQDQIHISQGSHGNPEISSVPRFPTKMKR